MGDLRFRAPVWPKPNRSQIQDGSNGRVCPQALPTWEEELEPNFLLSVLTGSKLNQSTDLSTYPYIPDKLDPRTTEDCLFLDVVVPQGTFNRTQKKKKGELVAKKKLVPVMVWIYGGGFAEGDKSLYNPAGLMKQSKSRGEEMVYVALNYRVSQMTEQVLSLSNAVFSFSLRLFSVRRIWLAGWQ